MEDLKHHSKESIDAVLKHMEQDLKDLKKKRKARSDAGQTREKYGTKLPPQFRRYISSANQRGIKFELTLEEFNQVVAGNCVYCNTYSKIGVDRIDSSDGYNIDNVQPCCGICNMMKMAHTEEYFLQHALKIVKHRQLLS